MRILVVDNTLDPYFWGSDALRAAVQLEAGMEVVTRRGPAEDLPQSLSGFDGWVISGSRASCRAEEQWVHSLDVLIREAYDKAIPTLGVCYGHQSIVRALIGRQALGDAALPELGWTQIDKVAPSELFQGLPDTFVSFSSHQEEVVKVPPGFTVTARSEDCGIQGFEHVHLPIFGVQFHPERTKQDAHRLIEEMRARGKSVTYRGLGDDDALYDSRVGRAVFGGFLKRVAEKL